MPLASYLLIWSNLLAIQKPLAVFAVAGLLNLLLIRYFYHFQLSKSAQGIVFSTFIALLFLLFLGNLQLGI